MYTRLILREKLSDLIDSYYDITGMHCGCFKIVLIGDTEDKELRFLYDLIDGQLDADKMGLFKNEILIIAALTTAIMICRKNVKCFLYMRI